MSMTRGPGGHACSTGATGAPYAASHSRKAAAPRIQQPVIHQSKALLQGFDRAVEAVPVSWTSPHPQSLPKTTEPEWGPGPTGPGPKAQRSASGQTAPHKSRLCA